MLMSQELFESKNRFPNLGWPSLPYPTSEDNESQTLEQIRTLLRDNRSGNKPIAAVVIEPTQTKTGYSVSDRFLTELYSLTRDSEASLIVDERNTCNYATGKGFF